MTADACRDRRGDLAAMALGLLAPGDEAGLQAHLDGCAGCRDELAGLASTVRALAHGDPGRVGSRPGPPPALGERIASQVTAARSARRRRRLTRAASALVAAALVVAAALAGAVVALGGGETTRELTPFSHTPPGATAAFALEPNEHGTAVVLRHEGLDPDATYWLWLADDQDRRVSAGTFTGARSDGRVVLQSALALSDTARVWATDAEDRVVLDAVVGGAAPAEGTPGW